MARAGRGAGAALAPAVIGTVTAPPGRAMRRWSTARSAIEVELAHDGMTLADADAAGLDAG